MRFYGFLIVGLFFLTGCNCFTTSARGTIVDSDDVEKIAIGKTSKAEIIGLFGVPDQVISRHSSNIDIHETTQTNRSRFDKDRASMRASGEVGPKNWGRVGGSVAAGARHGNHSDTSHSKSTSISTPASAIASQGDIFVYRRVKDATYNLKIGTIESTTYETLTVVFDEMDMVISYSYKD